MNNLIDMHNTTVYRGRSMILQSFSLKLPLGCNIAILGPNGAGKTTLLKVLMRELYPVRNDDSWVRILDKDTWNVWELRKNLGFISQDLQNRYLGYVTGREVVLSGYHSSVGVWDHQQYGSDRENRALEIMRQLNIEHLRDTQYSRISTGEQRRFLLARALISDPKTLVLDEPTSGLDLNATFHYLKIIRALMSQGKQLVLVTHHIHEIPPEISTVVLLKHGRVVEYGQKKELLTDSILTDLYETPIRVVSENGYYQTVPDD